MLRHRLPMLGAAALALGGLTGAVPADAGPPPAAVVRFPGCLLDYIITSQWTGGFVVEATIHNTGTVPANKWIAQWHFAGDERITSIWNVQWVQDANWVGVMNAAWNATIPAGGVVSFGFVATSSAASTVPTGIEVNGIPC